MAHSLAILFISVFFATKVYSAGFQCEANLPTPHTFGVNSVTIRYGAGPQGMDLTQLNMRDGTTEVYYSIYQTVPDNGDCWSGGLAASELVNLNNIDKKALMRVGWSRYNDGVHCSHVQLMGALYLGDFFSKRISLICERIP
jgi:hypothetical protein